MSTLTDAEILSGLTDVQALALTMVGEARGDSAQGHSSVEERIAVGCTIRNRARTPKRWGDSLKAVCLQPKQFSCWNGSDPNRVHLLATAYRLATRQPTMDPLVDETLYLAEGIASGRILDTTLGSDHYLTANLFKSEQRPRWVRALSVTRQIGSHVFLRRASVVLLVLGLAAPARAQDTPQTIALLEAGFFRAYKNEVALDTKPSFRDPVKFRGGAWWPDSWLVIVSGDYLQGNESNPRRGERGFFGIRHNDDSPKESLAQEFAIFLTDNDRDGDQYQKVRLRLTTDYLELFGRRVTLGGAPLSSYLAAGRFELHLQESDGNFVLYERVAGTLCPRWAISWLPHNGTGFIDRAALDPPCQ